MIEIDLALARGAFRLELSATLAARSTGVFGPSGAGKSSLLHALAGLLPAQRLRLRVDGETLVDSAAGLRPPTHRRRIGLVFQDHRLFPHLRVRDNLAYGAQSGGPAWKEVIEVLDVGDLLGRFPHECSGGQRQRIAVGRALLAAPRLLLLDEPLANLDRALKGQILPYLRRIQARFGIPVVMVSHDLEDLLTVADELLLLERGAAVGQGTLEDLTEDPVQVARLYTSGLVTPLVGTLVGGKGGNVTVRLDGPHSPELVCVGTGAPGERVEVLLRPQDLVLALPPVQGSLSVTNRLPGAIRVLTATPQRTLVRVDVGAARPLLVEVTASAVERLGLAVGTSVVVLAKAQALHTLPA